MHNYRRIECRYPRYVIQNEDHRLISALFADCSNREAEVRVFSADKLSCAEVVGEGSSDEADPSTSFCDGDGSSELSCE